MNNQSYTSSSISAGMQCPKLYKYKYVLGYGIKANSAMLVGTLVHKGLEMYWLNSTLEDALDAMSYMANLGDDTRWWHSTEGRVAYRKCQAYVRGYYKKYKGNDSFLEGALLGHNVTIRVEEEFEYESNGIKYKGKMDVVIFDHDTNEIIVIDHKTTGSSLNSYFDKLPLDVQITIYRQAAMAPWSAKAIARLPRVFFDVIGTSKSAPKQKTKAMGGCSIRRKKDETDEELEARREANHETLDDFKDRMVMEYTDPDCDKYVRHEIMCTSGQHSQRLIELEEYAKLLENKGFLEIRNSTACGNYGGCSFLNICLGKESLNDSARLVKLEDKHPELDGKGNNWVSYRDGRPTKDRRR